MKITINEHKDIQLEQVYNPVVFISNNKEKFSLVMRDSGFEVWYQKTSDSPHETYEFKDGVVRKVEEMRKA